MEYWKGSPLEGGQGGVIDGVLEYWNNGILSKYRTQCPGGAE